MHKYQVRQLVKLTRRGFADLRSTSGDVYEVTRVMPADQSGELSYRIKSTGADDRAVRESEITARVAEAWPAPPGQSAATTPISTV